jgi:hypothetical protein
LTERNTPNSEHQYEQSYVHFPQLWKGEQAELSYLASQVPNGGQIVEIGTAQGGTSLLMSRAVSGNSVSITTVDISPDPVAFKNLENTDVEIIPSASTMAASKWDNTNRPSIDLLFIDGAHDFKHCLEDFNAWAPLLNPGGIVLFHDYDPIERGGVKHLGVQIVVDTIIRLGLIRNIRRRYKMLSGQVSDPTDSSVSIKDCIDTIRQRGNEIDTILKTDLDKWVVVADDRLAGLLKACLKFPESSIIPDPSFANWDSNQLMVSAHPDGLPLSIAESALTSMNQVVVLDSLKLSYITAYGLKNNYHELYTQCPSRPEFLYWAETIAMAESGFGPTYLPHRVDEIDDSTIDSVSLAIAREQVRVTLYSRVLQLYVGWTP